MSTKLAPSVILVLLATLLATPLAAQTSRPTTVPTADGARADSAPADGTVASELVARIEAQLAAIRKTHELPAIAACVVRRGKVLANVAIGQRRADDPTAVSTEDLWHLGSCTKAMTATMLARLVERGRLRWDSTIGEITAQAKGFAATHAGWRAVTIAQLLRHRAGMPANPPRTAYEIAARLEPEVRARRHRVIASVLERPPASAPGSREEYSNAGYMTAGVLAELVTGESWETLMAAEVFEPLGMQSAGFGPPGDGKAAEQPFGHSVEGERLVPMHHDNPAELGPAGTVHASLVDWAKFVAVHVEAGRDLARSPAYLQAATFDQLHDPEPNRNYAAGFVVSGAKADRTLWHNGSNTLWFCACTGRVVDGTSIVVATNVANRAAIDAALGAIAELTASRTR